jgi:hypothetical protein
MDVIWSFEPVGSGKTLVRIVHEWDSGPAWPVPKAAQNAIADQIIGPVFIRKVAGRTLEGVRARAERIHSLSESTTS